MPKLHQDENGNFFIVQHSSVGGAVPEFTKYGVSEKAVKIFSDFGIWDGSSIPHEVFHRLRESGHIRPGTNHLFEAEDVVNQQVAYARIREFFSGCSEQQEEPEQLVERFKIDVLLTLTNIPNAFLRQQMFLYVAEGLSGQPKLKAAEEMFLERTPPQWKHDVFAALGRAYDEEENLASPNERAPSPSEEIPAAERESAELSVEDPDTTGEIDAESDLVELPSIERLPHEVRAWLFNTYSSYPSVRISESTDPSSGEITICFEGLPQGLAEAMVNALLRATPRKRRKRRKKVLFNRERQDRSFGPNVPIGGQPGWRRKIRRP
jgi:hypothetical protein